jgi:hypothetical protein
MSMVLSVSILSASACFRPTNYTYATHFHQVCECYRWLSMRDREHWIRRIWGRRRVCLRGITVSMIRCSPHHLVLFIFSDNCKIGLYCDTNSTTCIQQKALGASCSADKECTSFNCLPSRVCGAPPSKPRHLSIWIYLVIGVGIFGGKAEQCSTNSSLLCVSLTIT